MHYSRYFVTLRIRNPKKTMGATILYKYLDADGGLKMLTNSNLQFTNATRLNDPFDCHPAMFDYSHVPPRDYDWPTAEFISHMEERFNENLRYNTWVCSLSKVHDSILMWAYYGNHEGVCVGLDIEKADKYLSKIICANYIGAMKMEIQYKDIIDKPDFFRDVEDHFCYLLSTKAKAWEHEKEVRMLLINPNSGCTPAHLPSEPKDENEINEWEEVRFYPRIGGECFESLYLGINIDKDKREELIKVAKERNPNIKIYQMTIDPDAFRLKEELIK